MHDARNLINEVVEQRCKKSGNENGYTLFSKLCLARIKSGLGLEVEAETDMRALIDIGTAYYGDKHFGVLLGRAQLGKVLVRQRRYSEAEKVLEDVTKPSRYEASAREGGEHPDRLFAIWYTVECYQLQGKIQGAIELCTTILQGLRTLGGEQHPLARLVEKRLLELREQPLAPPEPPPYQSSIPGA